VKKDGTKADALQEFFRRLNRPEPPGDLSTLPVHPAAELFPLMSDAELEELAADIRERGCLTQPVVLFYDEKKGYSVIDGRNRIRACALAGVKPNWYFLSEDQAAKVGGPVAFVLSCNLYRCHLTAEQKRQVVAAVLKEQPRRSNRSVAKKAGVDDKTVGSVRKELERRAEIPHVSSAKDSKGREQPVRKAALPMADADAEPRQDGHVTLAAWRAMGAERRAAVLAVEGDRKFNPQGDSESIEWALWSWNPVTGCEHNCPYCYARDIATTGPTADAFPNGFTPTLIPGRLTAPRNTPLPTAKIAAERAKKTYEGDAQALGLGNVFVCSMADLFGRWVPKEWIDDVLAAARAAPRWNFLFLTKFPARMAEFDFPDNAWVGTTVDCQARVANAERAFRKIRAGVKWLSCEPMIEPLKFKDLGAFQWLVLGGASRSSRTPEWHPPWRWVSDLTSAALAAGCRVYHKTNLKSRLREFPGGGGRADDARAPDDLRYLILKDQRE
jgi:protein gp37